SAEKPHFTGNVAVALRTETDGEWTEKALIQHVWPTASTILNEHARRLGVRNLHLPFSAPENSSFNVQSPSARRHAKGEGCYVSHKHCALAPSYYSLNGCRARKSSATSSQVSHSTPGWLEM